MHSLLKRRRQRREARDRLHERHSALDIEEQRQKDAKEAALLVVARSAALIQSLRRGHLGRLRVKRLKLERAKAVTIQAVVRGRLGRKRRDELLLEQRRVVKRGIAVRLLLKRSTIVRRAEPWREMRDSETNAVFYYNSSNLETQWEVPFEFNNGMFPCNWGECEREFSCFEELEAHRLEHNWLCPACWFKNPCDCFPECRNCNNGVDIDGFQLGDICPEWLTNEELIMHLRTRKQEISARRQDMIDKLSHIVMFESKARQRARMAQRGKQQGWPASDASADGEVSDDRQGQQGTVLTPKRSKPKNGGQQSTPPVLQKLPPMLERRVTKEKVPKDCLPPFSASEAHADMPAQPELVDMEMFKAAIQAAEKEAQAEKLGLQNNAEKLKKKRVKRTKPLQIPPHVNVGKIYLEKIRNGHGLRRFGDAEYVGDLLEGQANGRGVLTYADGSYYEGEFKLGERVGKGSVHYADGSVFRGSWKTNKKHGLGILTTADGDVVEGQYVQGHLQGKGMQRSLNGDLYEGQFKNGRYHGIGKFSKSNGDRFVGHVKNGLAEGPGILQLHTGEHYRGHFQCDMRHG